MTKTSHSSDLRIPFHNFRWINFTFWLHEEWILKREGLVSRYESSRQILSYGEKFKKDLVIKELLKKKISM